MLSESQRKKNRKLFLISVIGLLFFQVYADDSSSRGITLEIIVRSSPTRQVIYVVTVDPAQRKITLEHAAGGGCSREPVSSIVDRVGGLAGLNCNNYRRGGAYNGNAVDFLKIGTNLFADPGIQRSVICWNNGACKPVIGPLRSQVKLSIGRAILPVDRVNQPRADNEAIVYTPAFGSSTRTRRGGTEIIIAHNRVINIIKEKGNAPIPHDGFVYSIGKNCSCEGLTSAKKKMPVRYKHEMLVKKGNSEVDISCMDYVASGSGILIDNGTCVSDFEDDFKKDKMITHCADETAADFAQEAERKWLLFEQHPRTAVGILPDGKWLFVVVDGRQPGYSMGIRLPDLAQFMLERSCVCALNMGGGGCSTLYSHGTIINRPCGLTTNKMLIAQSDKQMQERPVCSAFVIF